MRCVTFRQDEMTDFFCCRPALWIKLSLSLHVLGSTNHGMIFAKALCFILVGFFNLKGNPVQILQHLHRPLCNLSKYSSTMGKCLCVCKQLNLNISTFQQLILIINTSMVANRQIDTAGLWPEHICQFILVSVLFLCFLVSSKTLRRIRN